MRIIIFGKPGDFTKAQNQALNRAGKVIFIEGKPDYRDNVFTDDEAKVIGVSPEATGWSFPNEVIDKIPNLRAVCLPTTGFDWVDGAYLKKRKILLSNVAKYSTEAVAEYAISLMFNLVKKMALIEKSGWKLDYDKHLGIEVRGKTMGIIGLGCIGTRIAELGKALGMNVMYWSKKSRNKKFSYKSVNAVLKLSDIIFPTMAKNKQTNCFLNSSRLGLLKQGAYIVNIAGTDLMDLSKAIELLDKGRIAGIAFESETKKIADYKGNVWVTPPVAWYTQEALSENARIWTENMVAAAKGLKRNVVN